MVENHLYLDISRKELKSIAISQYDKNSRIWYIHFTNNNESYDISSYKVEVKMLKPDNVAFWDSDCCSIVSNSVKVVFSDQMCVAGGIGNMQIIFTDTNRSKVLNSFTIKVVIEKAVFSDDVVVSEIGGSIIDEVLEAEQKAKGYAESAKTSETNAKASEVISSQKASESATSAAASLNSQIQASSSEQNAKTSETKAKTSETNAKASETNAKTSETKSDEYQGLSKSYAIGTDGQVRVGDATDNAKYYYQQCADIVIGLQGTLLPMGTIPFESLPTTDVLAGYMYNISNDFTSDDRFKDGGGKKYGAGTNCYYTADNMWDCLTGSFVSATDVITTEEINNLFN